MKFLSVIQKIFRVARVLVVIAICLFFLAAGYELTLVGIELLTHGSKAIDKHLIAHALEHMVHFVANGILLVFVFKYIKHEIHDGTPYTEEGAKELGITLESYVQTVYGSLATWDRIVPYLEESLYVSAYCNTVVFVM